MRRLAAVLLLLLAGTVALATTAAPGPGVVADRVLLERAVREARVDTRPVEPSILEWLRSVTERAIGRLLEALNPGPRAREAITTGVTWASFAAIAVAGVALAVVLKRLWRRRLSRSKPSVDGLTLGIGASSLERSRDAADWWERLQVALDAGATSAAQAALWWWLATALIGSNAEPSWTSRQLLERAGRRDLRRLVGRLDALAYGPTPAHPDAVRHLARELAELVS